MAKIPDRFIEFRNCIYQILRDVPEMQQDNP
jgi:hypothetical protein